MHRVSQNSLLLVDTGIAVFIGSIYDTSAHAHHAIQIVLGLQADINIVISDKNIQTRCVIVARNVEHRLICKNGIQILLLIEPESVFGKEIQGIVPDKYLEFEIQNGILERMMTESNFPQISIGYIKGILGNALNTSISKRLIDKRIELVLRSIEALPVKKTACKKLTKTTNLSESRLQHLFKLETGISIKHYLLWRKMIDGIMYVVGGVNFTEAAYNAGFSDSAHMSRTFKKMFGINLIGLFCDSRSVQVIIEKTWYCSCRCSIAKEHSYEQFFGGDSTS
jgi:AraC-like DNA-binding protein